MNSAVNNGYEIQIDADRHLRQDDRFHLRLQVGGPRRPRRRAQPPGEWNGYEILVEGERLRVYLNGRLINDFTNTVANRSLAQGYIGLQNHGTGDDVSFRNVRIKELSGNPPQQPTTIEAESYTSNSGVQPAGHATASGGTTVGYIDNGDWVGYSNFSTAGKNSFSARVSSGGPGGTITIRAGSQTGTVLGTVSVPNTGSWDTFQTVTTSLNSNASGPLFLTFSGGSGALLDVDTVTLTTGSTPTQTTVQGEAFTSQSGVQTAAHGPPSAGPPSASSTTVTGPVTTRSPRTAPPASRCGTRRAVRAARSRSARVPPPERRSAR